MNDPRPSDATEIPPPPPLPPPPRQPRQPPKSSKSIALSSSETHALGDKLSQSQVRPRVKTSNAPFQPCHMFLYGTLTDPEVLQSVLHLPSPPTSMPPAFISGFNVKMWGTYPALIPSDSSKVKGRVWKVDSEEHFNRLAAYETAAYTWIECEVIEGCRAFCWAGHPESTELEDGSFDLERYQKYFKASVTRRRSPAE